MANPILGMILIFGTIIAAVIITPKIKMNFGIFTMTAAFLIGMWVLGLGSGAVIAFFPARMALTIILFTFFAGFVRAAGVYQGIADRILYAFRRRPALIPFAVFLAATAVDALGGGAYAAMTVVGPIALSLAEVCGFSPIIAIVALWAGAGTQYWWVQAGTGVHIEHISTYLSPEYADVTLVYVLLGVALVQIIPFLLTYVIFKGWKNNVKGADIVKPAPFAPEQKKVLYILCVFMFFVAVPSMVQAFAPNPVTAWLTGKLDMFVLLIICGFVMAIMKVADCERVIREDIPWSLIIMLCGTTMLVKLLGAFGTIDYLSSALASSVNPFWIIPALLVIGGVLTMFSDGLTVIQTIAPLVFSVAAATGLPQIGAYVAAYCGTQGPSISPFSTGGSLALMNTTPSMDRAKIMRQQIFVMVMNFVVQFLLGVLGVFNWMLP